MMIMAWDHLKDEIALYCGVDGTHDGDGRYTLAAIHPAEVANGRCYGEHSQAWYAANPTTTRALAHQHLPVTTRLVGTVSWRSSTDKAGIL